MTKESDITNNVNPNPQEGSAAPEGESLEFNGESPSESSEVDRLQAEVEKWKKDYLYLKAEFDNYRRNAIKEKSDLMKYGPEKFITEFLNIFDLFESALAARTTPENLEAFRKGFDLLHQETKNLLNKFGIQDCPALGEDFDPMVFEALGAEETADFAPGKISKVLRKPYKFHDRLIRPGQVMVAKAPVKN
jgi:molecular chaperone GrpE